jgi:hypothetical protein
MYCRQRRHIYIVVAKIWNTICPPPPQFSLHRWAALTTNSNGTQPAQKGKGGRSRESSHVYASPTSGQGGGGGIRFPYMASNPPIHVIQTKTNLQTGFQNKRDDFYERKLHRAKYKKYIGESSNLQKMLLLFHKV